MEKYEYCACEIPAVVYTSDGYVVCEYCAHELTEERLNKYYADLAEFKKRMIYHFKLDEDGRD